MPDETVTAPPKASSKPGLVRLVAIILTLLTIAGGAVVALELPKMLNANQASALVDLMAKVNQTQQALATELNEVTMSGNEAAVLPDEPRTNQTVKDLIDSVKAVDLDGLNLPNDDPGRLANAFLTDPNGQLAKARETAYRGSSEPLPVTFDSLIQDGWVIQAAIVADLDGLNQQVAKQAAVFVNETRELPVPIIDPTGQSPDPHQDTIAEIAEPAQRDANSAKLLGWGSIGLTAVLALAAIGLWVLSVMKSGRQIPAPDAASTPASASSVGSKVGQSPTDRPAKAAPAPAKVTATVAVADQTKPAPAGTIKPSLVSQPAQPTQPGRPTGLPGRPAGPSTSPKAAPTRPGQPVGPGAPGSRPVAGTSGLRPPAAPPTGPVNPSAPGIAKPAGLRPATRPNPALRPGGPSSHPTAPAGPPANPPVAATPPTTEAAKPAKPASPAPAAKPRIPWRTTGATEDQTKE